MVKDMNIQASHDRPILITGAAGAIDGIGRDVTACARVYFGMSISANYLEATVNVAAVPRYHGIEAFVKMQHGDGDAPPA